MEGNAHQHQQRIRTCFVALGIVCGVFALVQPYRVRATGASLKISPSTGAYEVGGLVDVSFLLDTGGEAVNAVNADVQFPADKLQVVNPAASTSFISIWVTAPSYSNTDGTINFQGGLPNPGIKTSAGVISTVTFRVKASGKAVIKYAPTSKTLRNDGEGTNILTSTGTAEFQLNPAPPAGPAVTSSTHPDSNAWSNNPDVRFSWDAVPGAEGYSVVFDQNAKTTPEASVATKETSATVHAVADGVWYFHVRAKTDTWGGVTTYPVQIDRTPPATFTPRLDKNLLTVEETGTLQFVTTDAASGVDHYEVKEVAKDGSGSAANTLFVESGSPYLVPKHSSGSYDYIVRAIDRAGNVREGTATLTVIAAGLPFYARTPFLRNPAVANIALIILIILVLITIGILVLRRVRIRSTFRHDYKVLEHDAQHKYAELQKEMEELKEAQGMMKQQSSDSVKPPEKTPSS